MLHYFFRPLLRSQGGGQVIGIANRLRAARSVVCISVGQKSFPYPKRPDRPWGLFASLSIAHRGDRSMKLTTRLRLVPKLRMGGALRLLSLHALWLGQGRCGFFLRHSEA